MFFSEKCFFLFCDLYSVFRLHRDLRRGFVAAHSPSYTLNLQHENERSGIGQPLQRHPFSGPVHSAGELLHTP